MTSRAQLRLRAAFREVNRIVYERCTKGRYWIPDVPRPLARLAAREREIEDMRELLRVMGAREVLPATRKLARVLFGKGVPLEFHEPPRPEAATVTFTRDRPYTGPPRAAVVCEAVRRLRRPTSSIRPRHPAAAAVGWR